MLSEEECLVSCCLREGRELLRKEEQGNQVYELRGVPADLGSDEEGGRENKAVLVVVRDITMDEANSRQLLLSSKMAAIGQLAAGMAHQIRNPLGIIRNQSYILRKNGGDSPQTSRSLNYIDDSVKRASDIIDNVMNFWRISRDEIRTIKLHDFLQSVLLLQAEGIAKKKLKQSSTALMSCCLRQMKRRLSTYCTTWLPTALMPWSRAERSRLRGLSKTRKPAAF